MYRKYLKRMMDIFCSFVAIIVFSPVILVLFLLVRIKLGSPILFRQKRLGRNEKIFTIYKFRTMTDKRDANGSLLPDQERLTKFGLFLRSTSLDELPELFNILKGDLSIVGPRSLLVEYQPYYTEYERQRHSIRGGLTPPEVLYDNIQPTWEEQFQYEVDYTKNISFFMDVKIIIFTFKGLLQRKSVNYGMYVRKSLIEERSEMVFTFQDTNQTASAELEPVSIKK
ncbi:MAG: sugar transferase [Oscillospiraceae bacterium]|nr:sugar transferase [Oscillospiraceae bacterium]MDD4414990.1 sugar transferase [Oscillospiraceae bacterium]